MANPEHLEILKQGFQIWNQWRSENCNTVPNLSGASLIWFGLFGVNLSAANLSGADLSWADLYAANLTGANLTGANLRGVDLRVVDLREANLSGTNLSGARYDGNTSWPTGFEYKRCGAIGPGSDLYRADLSEVNLMGADLSETNLCEANLSGTKLYRKNLSGADLSGADLSRADLSEVNLMWANLSGANLSGANLTKADLRGAHLRGADLRGADLVRTNFEGATLTGCRIFGVSAWGLNLKKATQADLIISDYGEPIVTVDNLEVAQFIYLLLNNERVRDIINTITTKVVLILGRFTPDRKAVLDAIREELRRQNYIPVLFDFDKPASRDLTETIRTLAHLARFVIADITDPRSVPQELQAIVPDLAVPVQAVIQADQEPWGMFQDFPHKYHWVLAVHRYRDLDDLLASLRDKVIGPAEAKAKELQGR